MGILAKLFQRITDHPDPFIFFRSVFENNFKIIRSVILRELRLEQGVRTLDLGCGPCTFSDLIAQEGYWIAGLNRCYIEYACRASKKAILLRTAPVGFLRYQSI